MDCEQLRQLEIENIDLSIPQHEIPKLIKTFSLYDESNSLKYDFNKYANIIDKINIINSYETDMCIISYVNSFFILVFDFKILIIKQDNYYLCKDFFDKNLSSIFFFNSNCKKEFYSFLTQNHANIDSNKFLQGNNQIEKRVIECIIRKSQYLTIKKRYRFESCIENVSNEFNLNDFVFIKGFSSEVSLRLNIKNLFLYILKIINNEVNQKKYEHEIEFYKKVGNSFPYVQKLCCQIQTKNIKYIVLEYVEGQTLRDYILNKDKKISFTIKIKIILEILLSTCFILSNGIFLRDMKWDNIIIDSSNNAILIDFDSTKEIKNDQNEQTSDIGNFIFVAPEQQKGNNYNYKVDIYSIGMIIHFILTETRYIVNHITNEYLDKLYEDKINSIDENEISKYECLNKITKKCLDESPNERPEIINIIENITTNECFESSLKIVIPEILKAIENNFDQYKNSSYIAFFLGITYYEGEYILHDIDKAIYYLKHASDNNYVDAQLVLSGIYIDNQNFKEAIDYLTLAANLNNASAQTSLGVIYKLDTIYHDIKKSIYYLTLASDQNEEHAQYILGVLYYDGQSILRDINKSIHYLTLAANHNNSDAQYLLGDIYYYNLYVSQDIEKSIYYLKLAAKQNNVKAQYLLGYIFYAGKEVLKDINQALYYLKIAADQEDLDSQLLLGLIYFYDESISKDTNKAIYYLTQASNQNSSQAQTILGFIYYKENNILRDIYKSIYYLSCASIQNNSTANYLLGEIYYEGRYVLRDINKAIHYLTLSSNQNDSNAQYLLSKINYEGLYVSRDIKKSIYYLALASSQYHSNALYFFGLIYYQGIYITRDINKSIFYLTLASNENNSFAQSVLGEIYYKNEYIKPNIKKAIFYLTLASKQNENEAQYLLGEIYYEGEFVLRNIEKAIHYFKESSCFNNNKAKNCLGIIYKNGDGVKTNIMQAIEYFEEAIKQKNDLYSMYNLARIYYFGIGIKEDRQKSIEILKKASNKLFIADLFLFLIFTIEENKVNSFYYRNIVQKYYNLDVISIFHQCILMTDHDQNDINEIIILRLKMFFMEYDLLYSKKQINSDLMYFMKEGKMKPKKDKNQYPFIKPINEHFYKGFYDE